MASNIYLNSSFVDIPLGLKLQQVLTSSGTVTLPPGIKRVYAICIGGGGGGGTDSHISNATITNVVANGTTWTYTTSVNHSFVVGDFGSTSGINPGNFNTTSRIVSVTANTFSFSATGIFTYVSGGSAIFGGGGGGGAAGAISAGWTYAANTCVIGAGGLGGSTEPNGGFAGGATIYGSVFAGYSGGGPGGYRTQGNAAGPSGIGSSCGGNSNSVGSFGLGSGFPFASYTGALAPLSSGHISYTASNNTDGVNGGGGTGNANTNNSSVSAFSGGNGLIGGGGGSSSNLGGTRTGGNGGNGDKFNGGLGSSGTGNNGAGGGGGGFLGPGSNASGNNGGNGGFGGGGGGAGIGVANGGAGGNGAVILYY